jgi:hypothetical protein
VNAIAAGQILATDHSGHISPFQGQHVRIDYKGSGAQRRTSHLRIRHCNRLVQGDSGRTWQNACYIVESGRDTISLTTNLVVCPVIGAGMGVSKSLPSFVCLRTFSPALLR